MVDYCGQSQQESPDKDNAGHKVQRYKARTLRQARGLFPGLSLSDRRCSSTGQARLGFSFQAEGHIRARMLLASPQGLSSIPHPPIPLLAEKAEAKREEGQRKRAGAQTFRMEEPGIVGMRACSRRPNTHQDCVVLRPRFQIGPRRFLRCIVYLCAR
jgi:hypothetical protein